jgi:DNA-directed RNA polymerase specialized sigma subunit
MENIIQMHSIDPEMLASIIKTVLKEELKQVLILLKSDTGDEYLSRKQAAKFLHISETTLWTLDKNQILPAKRLNGKVLYLKSDLLNFHKHAA